MLAIKQVQAVYYSLEKKKPSMTPATWHSPQAASYRSASIPALRAGQEARGCFWIGAEQPLVL